jgi:hypothetical protein
VAVAEALGVPVWAKSSLKDRVGRDPLGLQTTTQDRLTPLLLPGVLELSRQPRYLSFHAWLLLWFQQHRLEPTREAQESFIRRAEWDLGLAVLACRRCDSSPVGVSRLRAEDRDRELLPRGMSVQTEYGGYGLYYRSPLGQIGCVAFAGTALADGSLREVDVLTSSPRAAALAAGFDATVGQSRWVREGWPTRTDLMPRGVVDELAEVGCLCQLPVLDLEREAVHAALFEVDATDGEEVMAEAAARRLAFGHYLSQLDGNAAVLDEESAYRRAIATTPPESTTAQAHTAGLWAGLIAKDVWQEALCSLWDVWLETAFEAVDRLRRDTLTPNEVDQLLAGLAGDGGGPALELDAPTSTLVTAIANGLEVSTAAGRVPLRDLDLEGLRVYTEQAGTAASALLVTLALQRLVRGRNDAGWTATARVGSAWQPSLTDAMGWLERHLTTSPSVTDTVRWLTVEFVLSRHEAIANSKLPEFTFRWRWEEGWLRLFDHGRGRFPRAAVRQVPFATVSRGLALWDKVEEVPQLTERGHQFVAETFA